MMMAQLILNRTVLRCKWTSKTDGNWLDWVEEKWTRCIRSSKNCPISFKRYLSTRKSIYNQLVSPVVASGIAWLLTWCGLCWLPSPDSFINNANVENSPVCIYIHIHMHIEFIFVHIERSTKSLTWRNLDKISTIPCNYWKCVNKSWYAE